MQLPIQKNFRFVLFTAVLTGMLLRAPSTVYAAASLTITPITWNVVGLDSNNVNVGPSNFPVGARVCNTGDATASNVVVDFVWDDGLNDFNGDSYINLRSGSYSSLTVPGLAAGACEDVYFEIAVTRSAASYDKTRDYHITAASNETAMIGTPSPREIYVEHLVSQNRNSVTDIKLDGVSIAAGGTMNLMVGSTYTIQLVAATATNGYEQIESFINFPNTIFQINSVVASYSAFPTPHTDPRWASKLYADGCGWVNDPNDGIAPAYRECSGVGKYGGNITVTYNVTIIGGGGTDQSLNTLIYDFSGSSYHYNSDFSSAYRVAAITDPSLCTQVTIAEWNFDLSLNAASTDNAVGTPNISTGAGLSIAGSVTGNPGSARSHTSWNTGAFDVNSTDYLQFNVSTEGYYNIQYAYDVYRTAQGPLLVAPAYDENNTGAPSSRAARNLSNTSEWYSFSEDLSSVTGMDSAPQARFLLYGYNASGTGGVLRVDNFKVTGCAFPASLNLVKTSSTDSYTTAGQQVTYNYALGNSSQVPLRAPFTLTDDKIPGVSCVSPATVGDLDVFLDPGEGLTCTATYTIAAADLLNGSVTNNASATAGNAATGTTVTSNPAAKTITSAAMTILKEVSSDGITWNDTGITANIGDTVTYRITVDNTGNTDLTNITVEDNMPACILAGNTGDLDADHSLDIAETWVYTCSVTAVAGTSTNTATADSDQTAQVSDDAVYVSVQPDLTVTKTNNVGGSIAENNPFQWMITVTNNGAGDAIFSEGQKVLSDPLPGGATYNPLLLIGGGAFSQLECSLGSGAIVCAVMPGGGVTINPGGRFSVTVMASPTAPGTLANTAIVDPDGAIAEGNEANNSASDSVTVIDVPDAVDDSASTSEGVAVTTGVLANDDQGTEPTTVTANTQGTNGSVTCTVSDCIYTPAPGFTGTDSYTYTITDANGNRDTATVTINVVDLPDAADDAGTTNEGVSVSTGVLANDNLGAEPTIITSYTQGGNGTVTCTATECTYTPDPGYTGTDMYTYTIIDANSNMDTATVTVTVVDVPGAADDTDTTDQDTPVTTTVLNNDDLGAQPTTIAVNSQGTNGTVTCNATQCTYTPAAGFTGGDSYTYTIADANGNISTATVSITVTPLLVAVEDSAETEEGAPVTTRVLTNDDLGAEPTTITAHSQGTDGTITCTAVNCTYTPGVGFSGTDTYTYTITDRNGKISTATVTVMVVNLPDAAEDSDTTGGGVPVTTPVLLNDDLGTGPATITGNTQGMNGTVSCTPTQCTYTPAGGFSGVDTYTYTITDNNGNTDTATVTITVQANPGLEVVKEVSAFANGPWNDTSVTVTAGDTVYYRVRVLNTGNVTLTGLTVNDVRCVLRRGADITGNDDDAFEAGEEWAYGCSVTAVLGTQENTVFVDTNETPFRSDTASYVATAALVVDPALSKVGDPSQASVGETVTFTLVVTNEGTAPAPNVIVTDALPGMFDVSAVHVTGAPLGTMVNVTPPIGTGAAPYTVVVTLGGNLSLTDVVTIQIVTTVNGRGNPTVTNTATLTTSAPTDVTANNAASASITLRDPGGRAPARLPETGFPRDQVTLLAPQPAELAYTATDLLLEIPSLRLKVPIVGVPKKNGAWNVSWLGNQAGWLDGSAFPSWKGNSVLTSHVYLSNGLPGPFVNLSTLKYGEQIVVHAYGQKYTFAVQTNTIVQPGDTSAMKHEDKPWLTLVTCKEYDEKTNTYRKRVVVRAVLVSIE